MTTMHTIRFILVDDDEVTFEIGEDGSTPETFTSSRGVVYPCPQPGAATAWASLNSVIGRIHRDPAFGVPDVRACYAGLELVRAAIAHDLWCSELRFYIRREMHEPFPSLGPPLGRFTDHVNFFTPTGEPLVTLLEDV